MISATMLSVSPAFGETWTVVSEESFPPYNFVEEGRKTGIDTEIVNAVLKEIGVTSAHQGVPWNRVIAMLDQNQTDLAFQFVGTPERFEHYTLIGPHRVGHTVFATPTGSTLDYKTRSASFKASATARNSTKLAT
jgi:polar amino acid transport system substrate-binding protein